MISHCLRELIAPTTTQSYQGFDNPRRSSPRTQRYGFRANGSHHPDLSRLHPRGGGVSNVVGGLEAEGVGIVQGADKGRAGIIHRGQPDGPTAAAFFEAEKRAPQK